MAKNRSKLGLFKNAKKYLFYLKRTSLEQLSPQYKSAFTFGQMNSVESEDRMAKTQFLLHKFESRFIRKNLKAATKDNNITNKL